MRGLARAGIVGTTLALAAAMVVAGCGDEPVELPRTPPEVAVAPAESARVPRSRPLPREAVAYLDRALFNATTQRTQVTVSDVRITVGDLSGAAKAAMEMTEDGLPRMGLLMRLAKAYHEVGNAEAAARMAEAVEAIAFAPGGTSYQQGSAVLTWSTIARPDRAVQAAWRIEETSKPELTLSLARGYMLSGDFAAAERVGRQLSSERQQAQLIAVAAEARARRGEVDLALGELARMPAPSPDLPWREEERGKARMYVVAALAEAGAMDAARRVFEDSLESERRAVEVIYFRLIVAIDNRDEAMTRKIVAQVFPPPAAGEASAGMPAVGELAAPIMLAFAGHDADLQNFCDRTIATWRGLSAADRTAAASYIPTLAFVLSLAHLQRQEEGREVLDFVLAQVRDSSTGFPPGASADTMLGLGVACARLGRGPELATLLERNRNHDAAASGFCGLAMGTTDRPLRELFRRMLTIDVD